MSGTRVVNEATRPRILIKLSNTNTQRFDFLKTRVGTVRIIESLSEVSPDEWDIIVTDDVLAKNSTINRDEFAWWTRHVPLGLHVFFVHREDSGSPIDLVVDAADDPRPSLVIRHQAGIPGNAATRIDKLDFEQQRFAQKVLVPLVSGREYQWGHQPVDATKDKSAKFARYTPFLIGASSTVIAAHYTRSPQDSVWLVPSDVPDFEPWWDLALEEWHDLTPLRIPGLPKWQRAAAWRSESESALVLQLESERSAFAEAERQHHESIEAMELRLAELNGTVDANERLLLTAQGDDLQVAVFRALEEIGFAVEDMDAVWDPRERREDYRIRDASATDWMVIADATGTNGGTPGAKLQTLSTYVNKFLLEEKPDSIPGQWLISNQFLGRDPSSRADVLRGDDLRAFSAAEGLAIDTAGLFVLQRAVAASADLKEPMRAWMRALRGQLRLSDAIAWLAANKPS